MTKNTPNHDNNNDDVDTTKRKRTSFDYSGLGFRCLMLFLFFFLLVAIKTPCCLHARRSALESKCILTLRILDSAQLIFADAHDGDYGTWSELFEENYSEMSYTLDNLIDKYNIVRFEVRKSTGEKDSEDFIMSGFTIIAIPDSHRSRLRTYAICDDQIGRVWIGKESDWKKGNTLMHDISLWEPLHPLLQDISSWEPIR